MNEQFNDTADTSLILLEVSSSLLQISLGYFGEKLSVEQPNNDEILSIAKIIEESFTQINMIFSDPERPNETFTKLKALQKLFADESFETNPLPQQINMIRESLQTTQTGTGRVVMMGDCATTPWCPPKKR